MLSEVEVHGLAAAALSVPIGYGLGVYLNARLTAELFPVDTLPVLWDFTSVLVPAMLLMPLAAIMPIRAILRAPLPALLNERHFG